MNVLLTLPEECLPVPLRITRGCVCVCVFLCSFVCAPPVEPLHVLFPFQNNDGVITAGQSGSSSEAAETSNKPGSLLEQIHAFGCPTSGMHVEKQVCMQFYSCVACRDPPMKEASVTLCVMRRPQMGRTCH